MKNLMTPLLKGTILSGFISCLLPLHAASLSEPFKQYWYAGDAELTSYNIKQARYGELHEGTGVLVYVTEPFLAKEQVKADSHKADNIPVLKLNSTKKFLTGIYPYSIMSSTFSPVSNEGYAVKASLSVQEWCGHVFTQINNRQQFDVNSYSYFEGEADQRFSIDKENLENEIWTKIRLNPNELPLGDLQMVPSLEYLRLLHKPLKAYSVKTSLISSGETSTYTLEYPTLLRTLSIEFNNKFPYVIQGWKDTYKSGFDENAKVLTSSAEKINTIKSKYWQKHNNIDMKLRKELGL